MPVSFKTGSWTSRTTTGTDVITGVGFQPKIILFFSTADFAADDTFAADYNFRFGVATDTTAANQAAMASYSQDATGGVSNSDRLWYSSGPLLREVGSSATVQGAVSAIGSDGFTVNWTLADGSTHRIYYICIGGTDITNVKSGTLTTPTATGSVAYTQPGFKPDFLLLWGNESTTASPAIPGATIGLGYATSSTSQVSQSTASSSSVSTRDTARYQRSDNVICFVELDSDSVNAGAFGGGLTSMDTNGFTCNWTTSATAGRSKSFGYLAVKGGNWKVGSGTSKTSTGTQAYTGVGFQPSGVIFSSVCNSSSTAINANNRISFGGGSSSSDNRCVFAGDADGGTNSVTATIQKSAKCISVITEAATHTSSTVNAEASISTLDSNGFTLNWSTASATAFEFLYVAVGGTAAAQNITKTLTETVTIGTTIPTRTKNKLVTKNLTETLTLGTTIPTKPIGKARGPAAESVSLAGTVDTLTLTSGGKKKLARAMPVQTITFDDTNLTTFRTGRRDIVKALTETLHISENVNYIGKTKHTGDPGYWLPLKPRIKIYAFTDSTYSSPLYSYDAFTDSGTTDKPIGLQFESSSTTAGTFSIQIDNSADTYDLDMFSRGNRVTIECSKDSLVWASAYHGLVRSVKQKVFGPNNRIIYIEGFSYLIRLNERILSVKKQAALVGPNYNRNDSTMFTDNLINDLLTNDADYLKTVDDTQLYNVFKTTNITASPIDDWVPRLDVQLNTVNQAINNVLEFSQSFLTIDVTNDQVVLFNPDRVPSGGANAFLITDSLSLQGDSSLNTMYPISDYTYEISYDFADSGNRLISSIGNVECPETTIPGADIPGTVGSTVYANSPTQPSGSIGAILYNAWTASNYAILGPGSSATRYGVSCQDSDFIGKSLSRIAVAVRRQAAGVTGVIKVGIRKAADDSFLEFGTLDVGAVVPLDGAFHGYQGDNLDQSYIIQQFDHITVEDYSLSTGLDIAVMAASSTNPTHRFDGSTWYNDLAPLGYVLTAQIYQLTLDTSNWGTIKLNGTSIQRIAILVQAGSAFVGAQLGRITLSLRTDGHQPNGQFWVGIRKADNTFVYFGPGVMNGSSFTPNDDTFRNYNYDNLENRYKIVAGDRISIEGNMTTGYLELQCSKDGGSPNTVQIWNGSSYVTTGVVSFRVGGSMYLTTAASMPDVIVDPCGGLPETRDADPLLTIASDCNMRKRIGMVEQVIGNIPPHVKTFQTMTEFMFNKLYVMARPRFTFEYPDLTLPNIMPKAGDICAHVSKKAGIGVRRGVVQTGVITEVSYDFGQDSDSVLGLRRLSIETNGVLRGSY